MAAAFAPETALLAAEGSASSASQPRWLQRPPLCCSLSRRPHLQRRRCVCPMARPRSRQAWGARSTGDNSSSSLQSFGVFSSVHGGHGAESWRTRLPSRGDAEADVPSARRQNRVVRGHNLHLADVKIHRNYNYVIKITTNTCSFFCPYCHMNGFKTHPCYHRYTSDMGWPWCSSSKPLLQLQPLLSQIAESMKENIARS